MIENIDLKLRTDRIMRRHILGMRILKYKHDHYQFHLNERKRQSFKDIRKRENRKVCTLSTRWKLDSRPVKDDSIESSFTEFDSLGDTLL